MSSSLIKDIVVTESVQRSNGCVAVVYHYFAHYRKPIITELSIRGDYYYKFFGEIHGFRSGIEVVNAFPAGRFKLMRGWQLGHVFVQPSILWVALSSQYKALVLLGNVQWPTMWLAAILGRLSGKRVLLWTHGWLCKEHGLKKILRNLFYRLANDLLVYGHRAKCIGVKYMGFSSERIHVIYNSLDVHAQDEVRKTIDKNEIDNKLQKLFGERAAYPALITVSRLTSEKKIDLLLLAAHKLEFSGTPVNVIVVGDGPERVALEALSRKLDATVVFVGALYDERELGVLLSASALTVMPGPAGLLVMHSLAYGTPVITNNDFDHQMPEIEAIVPGQTGAFFEKDDLDSLKSTIEQWIDFCDNKETKRDKARQMIDKYYNPKTQRILIDRAVRGLVADDLDFPIQFSGL